MCWIGKTSQRLDVLKTDWHRQLTVCNTVFMIGKSSSEQRPKNDNWYIDVFRVWYLPHALFILFPHRHLLARFRFHVLSRQKLIDIVIFVIRWQYDLFCFVLFFLYIFCSMNKVRMLTLYPFLKMCLVYFYSVIL